jgi:hypothetical protein
MGRRFFKVGMTQICSSCQAPNREIARFCRACGHPLLPASSEKPTSLSEKTDSMNRPTESALGDAPASTVATTSVWMWPDQAETMAGGAAPLPPPFGLPPSNASATGPLSATGGQANATPARWAGRRLILPFVALGVIGGSTLLAASVWLWQTPAIPQAPSEKALSALEIPTANASNMVSTSEPIKIPEPQLSTPAAATQPEAIAPASQPEKPLVVQRPPPKADPKVAAAKLSIPALPAPAANATENPANTNAPPLPAAEVVISAKPLSPRDACASSSGPSQTTCLDQQCAKPELRQHTQCQRWRKEREQEFERLYGGS